MLTLANENEVNPWEDRSAVFVGDSITAGSGTTKIYYEYLEESLGFGSVTPMGVAGSCISAASDYGQANQPLINRYQDIPSADLIVIFMGTNDYGHETPLGSVGDAQDGTFYGALNVIIPALTASHPSGKIVFVTPLQRYGFGTSKILGTPFTSDDVANGVGAALGDYVDALKTVCTNNGVSVIDLYTECILDPADAETRANYMPDGLHPNAAGHEVIAGIMESHIRGFEPAEQDPIELTEMVYGNRFATGNNQTCRASSRINYYLKAGTVISLKDSAAMQWACTKTSDEASSRNLGYFPDSGWSDKETAVVTEDGWVGFTFKYRDETKSFDLTKPLSDYITIEEPHTHTYENGVCTGCGTTVSPYLQQLPENIFGCTNLYDSLVPVKGYYTATKYDTSNGAVLSVVIPVEPGDRIAASSFGAVSENMGSVNGIRVTYLLGDKIITSLAAGDVYNAYTKNGYITVPDGVDAVCVPWWKPSDSNWLTLSQISKDFTVHIPKTVSAQPPTCTESGYTAGEICEICKASLGEREEIPATGHSYSGDTCTVCGTVNVLAILDGKYVSILGDSISTFNGYSNDATVNTTIGGNGPRYDAGTADTKPGSYCLLESVDETWWMHFANRSGMKLLVNNSWAGSQVFGGKTSDGRVIPAAYLDRCVNLHDNTLENNPGNAPINPDVIFVYLGINDYNFNRGNVGNGAVDYAKLVNSDGTHVTPATFGEAYGIMLHKMRNAYPDAQIFAMTLLPENLYSVDKTAWGQHNTYIRAAAEYYGIPVVDLAENCAITWENFSGYMIDKIHPMTAGMELISDCIEAELVAYYKEDQPHTHSYETSVTSPTCTEQGYTTYTCECGESYVADYTAPTGFKTLEDGGAYLREQLVARETFVSLRMRGSFASDCYTQLFEIATRHTGNPKEGDYILANLIKCTFSSVSGTDEDGAYTDVTFAIEWLPGARQEVQVDAAVSEILNELNLWDASDYDKVKGIYDWITENITYDHDWDDTTSEDLYKHSTHAAVMTKTAVCQGIASLYYRLSLELGVDCRYISGVAGQTEQENHAWNIVCLEGKYYHMDPTWDLGMINVYRYFLVSGQDFPHHYRSEKFDTAAFHALYPMAELPYVQNVTASGTIGSKIQWVLDGDTGTLTVNGSGAIPSYRYTDAPWKAYRDSVTAIVVGEGITEVGERAFYWCKNCTQVTLPDSLVAIRQYGFNNLRSLQAITLPKHLRIIESCGFSECTALKSIVLPDSVTTVGSSAFSNCSALTSATLSAGMTSVPNSIFFGDRNLRTVVLPESITSIQDTAFMNSGIRQITLPAKVTSLGTACFAGCTSLQNIYVEAGNPAYKSVNGVLYTADGTHLICYPAARYGSYVIPEGTVYVDYDAFRESDVTAVTFPSTLTKIDAYAFSWCPFLKSVTFPQNITYIGDSAFRNCTALTGVTFQNESVFLEGYTFAGCKALKSVVLPSKLTSIPNGLFDDCIQLASIDIPSTVGSIGSTAFFNCDKLVSVTIPGNVRSIGQQAFDYCQNLTVITMKEGVRTLDWIAVRNAPNLTKVVIPASVTSIGRENFTGCPKAVLYVTCGTAGRSYAVNNGLNYVSTHAYTSTVTPPTCTAQGYTTHTCPCGERYVDSYVSALRHNYMTIVAPLTCTRCGDSLQGKKVSILSHSMSTYAGVSNNATANSTIGNNDVYYTEGRHDVYREDTWWQQVIDALGMKLLVNNSWSGSCVFMPRKGAASVGYGDRAVNLHNDHTGEEPDIVLVYLGCNDFAYYKDTFGKANEVDYAVLIRNNGDGTFSYSEPTTTCEAYAIMLHKVKTRYPDAEIYCITSTARREVDYTGDNSPDAGQPTEYSAELQKVATYFGYPVVDLEKAIPKEIELFDKYMGDKRAHANALGMDRITNEVISVLLGRSAEICHVVCADGTVQEQAVLLGGSYDKEVILQEGYSVVVTMNGEDITSEVYHDGKITIGEVTGDIVIRAAVQRDPLDFSWKMQGDALISDGAMNNTPTILGGTVTDGTLNNARYQLESVVVLKHDLPWEVEWKCAGDWRGCMFTTDPVQSTKGMFYLSRTVGGQLCFGTWTGQQYDNYGVDLSYLDDQPHTYRLVNKVFSDGSNMVSLFVDGVEVGAMNHYFIGSKDQATTSNWISGKDFVFPYISMEGHALQNCRLNYLSVRESGHTHAYNSVVTPPTCTAQGYTTHTCAVCGESYVDTYVPATRKHTYKNGICSGCGAAVPPLKGRTLSILGASISTFAGTSNGVAADTTNSTIRNNAIYYPSAVVSDVTLTDTWWMQACNDLGLQLLVNNSWSGSSLLHTRNGTVGAYVDRCLQLHDDTGENAGEEPDIIAIQMGTNDFQYYKDSLGTANIDYASLITQNGDGSFAYGVPATSLEAAAIVLHKISVRYPNAEVYYLNISQRVDGTDALIQSFNAELKKVVEHFGAHIVDIYGSAITMESFATYIGDGRVHPNKLGMDAYTEAFKAALLANTVYTAQTHKVSMDLSGVTADYGDDKLVIDGDRYVVNLTTAADMGLKVTVTMGGEDITHTAYADGTVVIDAVTADVTITAKSVYTPKNYRWVFDGSDLVCLRGENGLTKNAGTTVDGVFSNTRYALENAVILLHNLPWVVEWQSEGSFQNSASSSGARIFTSTDVNASYDARYIFKSNTNGIIAMGEKTSSGSHNYGIALGDHGIDWTELHTYRLENRIASDGANRIYLFVDGNEIGAMTHYYIGTKDQSTTSDWLSGKDFVFPYMGTDTHGFTNASIAYIAVMEGGCTHSYTSVVTPPTCTAQGYTTHTCTVCGDSYTDAFVPATGHAPGAAATCTEAQYCTVCTAELAPALGHALTQHTAKPATCTGIGWNAYETCSRCDHSTYSEIPALGHALTQHVAKPATCTDIGWDAYETCSRCDYSTYSEIPALGHALTQHGAKPATCTDIGWNAYETCSRCDHSTYSEIPALGHALTQHAAKPATCTGIGWNAYETCSRCDHSTYSEIPVFGHALTQHAAKPATCTGIGWNAYETCSRCDHSTYKELPALDHALTQHAAKPATCTGIGWNEYETCSRCDYSTYSEIPALGHALTQHTAKPATCTGIGWNAYETCSRCDYSTYKELPALGHDLTNHAAKPATCTGIGWDAYETCSRCDYSTYSEIPALGHALTQHASKPATCTDIGWNAYETCSRCDHSTYSEIPAAGHNYTHKVTAPTCTAQGYTTHTCHCGDTYVDSYVNATGHNFDDWYVTKAPTEAAQGEKRRDCVNCDYFETTPVAALTHDHNRWDVTVLPAVLPTCTTTGLTEGQKCSGCGEILVAQEVVPALSHNFGTWARTKAPTCTETGTERRDCQRCDHFETRSISALGHALTQHTAKPATCTDIGWNAYETCSRCDYSTYKELPALGHALTQHAAKPATCTGIGWDAYETCSRCDYSTYSEIPALGHALTQHAAKPATCTGIGWNAYETCSRCDYSTYSEIPALGHALTQHAAKPATCTGIGWNAYETCSRCDYSTYSEIPALGHALTQHAAKPATCTGIGRNAYETCSRCNYSTYSEIPALGHALTQHAAKPATCTGIGWNAYETCSRCDHSTYNEIPATGHRYTHTVVPPTTDAEGYTLHTCRSCGSSYKDNYEDRLPSYVLGDVLGDTEVDSDDAIYLLKHTLFPEMYPINQTSDFDGNGTLNSDDAIYLLKYTLFPDLYPLHGGGRSVYAMPVRTRSKDGEITE